MIKVTFDLLYYYNPFLIDYITDTKATTLKIDMRGLRNSLLYVLM